MKLSSPGAFDGLRIHTDEINEVINRIKPRSLTIAVVSSCLVFQNNTSPLTLSRLWTRWTGSTLMAKKPLPKPVH